MAKEAVESPADTLAFLSKWLQTVHAVVHHIGSTRGHHAPYCYIKRSAWPVEATAVLIRDTPRVLAYLHERHRFDVREPLERIVQTATLWQNKQARVVAFAELKFTDTQEAAKAARELSAFTDEGLPDQKRLHLDWRVAEGAVLLARFPLVAADSGRPFLIRACLVRWAIWVQKAFSDAIRDWSLPDEREILMRIKEEGEKVCVYSDECAERTGGCCHPKECSGYR